jgi:hypothetical protein
MFSWIIKNTDDEKGEIETEATGIDFSFFCNCRIPLLEGLHGFSSASN